MQRVLTAIVLVPLVVLAVFKAPFWLFALILAMIALPSADEYLNIAAAHNLKPLRTLTYVAVLAVLGYYYISVVIRGARPLGLPGLQTLRDPWTQYQILLVVVSLMPFVLLVAAMHTEDVRQALPSAAVSYMALPYIGITLGFLLFTRGLIPDGAFAILYLLLVVWAGDICAYYVGRSIGRHRLAPRISPGKSWEGAAASIVGSMTIGTLMLVYNRPIAERLYDWKLLAGESVLSGRPMPEPNAIWMAILVSVSINIAAQLGDLAESMMKRGADVKDSGSLLPGHGGILDRIDALLLASPVLWYYCSFRKINF
ncbi:MAG: CDP-archaeol synthase [Acidobacteria bacterium]|nr:MAG: CDP-archaeol synthase [Acidobacteriota bacterium]